MKLSYFLFLGKNQGIIKLDLYISLSFIYEKFFDI